MRRKRTGEVVNPAWLQFSFPTRWHYDAQLVPRPAVNRALADLKLKELDPAKVEKKDETAPAAEPDGDR
jgi:hypothetical protein